MMHKLVILIERLDDWDAFDAGWPEFLHQVEEMPGLLKETTCHVENFLYGGISIARMHELYFDTLEAAQQAMASTPGRIAGRLLQRITGGQMALFIAEHKEDDIENLRRYKEAKQDAQS
jgi:hypothetical protein